MSQRFFSKTASESGSGKALLELLAELGENDLLIVPSLACFGSDVVRQGVFSALIKKGIRLRVLQVSPEQEPTLVAFNAERRHAQFERARLRGAYHNCGRHRSVDTEAIRKLAGEGLGKAEIARQLAGKVSRSTVYAYLRAA